MPLDPLPPSNTQRFWIGVAGGGHQHHIQVRTTNAIEPAQAVIDLGFVVTTLQPTVYNDYTFNELLFAEQGSDIRNPVPGWEVVSGLEPFGQPATEHPYTICARGRSTSGRKVKLFLWGMNSPRDGNWMHIPVAESPEEAFLAILVTTPSYFLAIDGTKPVWQLDYTCHFADVITAVDRP